MQQHRRDFLKLTTLGATGLTLGRARPARAAWPATGTVELNPEISNLRVVACVDPKMMKSTPTATTFEAENRAIDPARVHANLDAMAMALAQRTTADEAWTTIFRSSKPWASTVVAIKVNVTEPRNMPRVAIVEKLCRVFAGLGVPAKNVIIYDGGPASFASNTTNYTPFFSVTDTAKIPGVVSNVNDALGGTTNAPIPNRGSAACTADVASGKVDILVNLAVNRGHIYLGRATLCMKNHFGTFIANHDDPDDYAFNVNKSDAIIGGSPPRQQLCIVDSLLANKGAGNGAPEVMPHYLVMGTFAPAVDYLTVKKVREEVMGCTHDGAAINAYVTSFGYKTSDPVWVLVPPAQAGADAGAGGAGAGGTGEAQAGGAGGGTTSGAHGTGGASGAGGARTGGAGGSSTPGSSGAGGAGTRTSVPRTGGASGSGGDARGGAESSGGASAGGTASGGSAGGASGGTTSSTPPGSAGAPGSGGAGGGSARSASSGWGCGIARSRGGPALGAALALGALVATRLRRLFERRTQASDSGEAEGPGSAKS